MRIRFTVTKTDDTFDAICDDDCSIREAVFEASPGDDIVVPAGTYTLTLGAQITIDKDLSLTGAGADVTIIEAATEADVASHRVFSILSGNSVAISGVTIQHGNTGNSGGGILNDGILNVADSTLTGNSASGGGIYNDKGMLTLTNASIVGNSASNGGGGIYNNGGTLSLSYSDVRDNSANSTGGGLFSSGTAELTYTVISGNSSGNNGGGIQHVGSTLTIINSTVGNNSSSLGGGILSNVGHMTLISSTISDNSAGPNGGGIRNDGTGDLINTIIARNEATSGPDCSGRSSSFNSLEHNFIGHLGGCSFSPEPSDITGTIDVPLDPKLGPLQDNGGPTETHALLKGSFAIDNGDNVACPATDQRGVPRIQGAACDIGAFELESSANLPPVAENDSYSVHQGSTLDTISDSFPGVLDNDKDPEGDDLIAIPVGTVSHGELALNPSGEFTYTPEPGFSGEASFIYFAFDGLLPSNEVTVTITVVPLCTLDIELTYADGTLTMDFEIGTLEPATWGIWLLAVGQVIPLWSTPIPVVDPSATFDIPIPFPSIGKIGVLTAMFTLEGENCFDLGIADTGTSLSNTLAPGELRELFSGVDANQVLSGE